jgi:cation diffusion facilitator family transporter
MARIETAEIETAPTSWAAHSHVFLGQNHERAERRTWAVIWLCAVMMVAEIVGGALFGSLALVADGLHMSTHAGALLLAALAYTLARKHALNPSFSFGTGKFGDLAGYSSAIILGMIALLIGYEAVTRFLDPVAISFNEAIPIAVLGLCVNVASAWLLAGGHQHDHDHGHGHGHSHSHGHGHEAGRHDHQEEVHRLDTAHGKLALEIFEAGVPPRFRVTPEAGVALAASDLTIETTRSDGTRQLFAFEACGGLLQSRDVIPEPHAFTARLHVGSGENRHVYEMAFAEHAHPPKGGAAHRRDNNMRAALVHVMADAAISVLVIVGLVLARAFGWLWMDPLAGLIGAGVIANWSFGLLRDTAGILLDRMPDVRLRDSVRARIECDGDQLTDLHIWRLGPGHLGAIVSVATGRPRGPEYYRRVLRQFPDLSHVTVEVQHAPS